MRLEDLSWMDVEAYLEKEDRLMVVLGSCEQHAYLSLLTDTKIPLALADAASQKTGVLVTPALPFGVSPHFVTYPGTISLRSGTYLNVVEDIIRSVYSTGFKRILVINGHTGNQIARQRMVELANELSGLGMAWYDWWASHSVEAIAIKHELKSSHASWIEAFPFVRVGDLPDEVKIPPAYRGLLDAEETRQTFTDGSFGGPYEIEPAIMEEILLAAVTDILDLLNF
jgi:creatinine amidohydrolase